jgi:MerR family transcriptional regulator, thiopeptide resistance regulator
VTGTEARWSVGALAKASGLTVRTLHHYDELGLLQPSERTHSGHRRYTEQDLHRLYQIRLLRQLGMPLDEIGSVLADPGALGEVLDRRLAELDDEIWRLNALSRQVRGLRDQLEGSARPDTGQQLVLLGRTSLFQQYITKEQGVSLAERADELGADGREQLDAEWPLVLTELAEHCRANDPVDDPQVQATVRRLHEVLRKFTGGDPAFAGPISQFFREHGLGVLRDVSPDQTDMGDELWDYVSRALHAQ